MLEKLYSLEFLDATCIKMGLNDQGAALFLKNIESAGHEYLSLKRGNSRRIQKNKQKEIFQKYTDILVDIKQKHNEIVSYSTTSAKLFNSIKKELKENPDPQIMEMFHPYVNINEGIATIYFDKFIDVLIAASNNASSPTVFTPYNQGSTKALTQLEQAGVQLSGSLSNQLLTNRLAVLETAQVSPFANSLAAGTAMAADGTKITTASAAVAMDDAIPTDNTVTVTGAAGSVDGGAQVLVTTGGSTAYDSVTVVASTDGSFAAKVRGDCMTGSSIPVSVTASVSGTSTASVSKTALCQGATETEDTVFGDIAGSDGKATIAEVLAYISGKGGLSAIITAGGPKLAGVIKAAKSALGLS